MDRKKIYIFCLYLLFAGKSFTNECQDLVAELANARIVSSDERYVYPMFAEIGGENSWGIFQHAPSEIKYKNIRINDESYLNFKIGILENAWKENGDGVLFEIQIDDTNVKQTIYKKYVNPCQNVEDRKLFSESIRINSLKNKRIDLIFKTSIGKDNSIQWTPSFDWGFWGDPEIVSFNQSANIHKSINKRNVILITMDTCRADYVTNEKYSWIQNQNLKEIIANGTSFDNAFSNSSTTNPSHSTILTSLLPFEHGVISNNGRLSDSIPRLPQIFKENGYNTAAFVSVAHLDDEFSGLGRWFDYYDKVNPKWGEIAQPDFAIFTRSAASVTYNALKWIRTNQAAPFFIWLHYYDPHTPYSADGEFHKMYYEGDPKNTLNFSMRNINFYYGLTEGALAWLQPFTDKEYFKREYAAEITYVDSNIGKLMSWMKQNGLDNETFLVLTADHGENLGDHDVYFDHWTMYNSDLHVPLVFYQPNKIPAGKRIKKTVSLIDLAPTILDVMGEGENLITKTMFDGVSLMPLWQGKEIAERIYHANGLHYMTTAAWDEKYKLIWELIGGRYHDSLSLLPDRVWVFDRESDPEEVDPVACFYWKDVGAPELSWDVSNEFIHLEKDLKGRIERTKDRICQKESPTTAELRSWFASGNERNWVKDSLKGAPEFYEEIIKIMKEMLSKACPPPIEDKLKNFYGDENFVLKETEGVANPLMKEALDALGYTESK